MAGKLLYSDCSLAGMLSIRVTLKYLKKHPFETFRILFHVLHLSKYQINCLHYPMPQYVNFCYAVTVNALTAVFVAQVRFSSATIDSHWQAVPRHRLCQRRLSSLFFQHSKIQAPSADSHRHFYLPYNKIYIFRNRLCSVDSYDRTV